MTAIPEKLKDSPKKPMGNGASSTQNGLSSSEETDEHHFPQGLITDKVIFNSKQRAGKIKTVFFDVIQQT